jgi:hypothetical protein
MRRRQDDHYPKVVRVAMAADLRAVMVPPLRKAMVSRMVGMDSLLQHKDSTGNLPRDKDNTDALLPAKYNTDSLLPAKDNTDSLLPAKDNTDNLLPAKDNTDNLLLAKDNTDSLLRFKGSTGSNQVAMADHHQTNLLMVVHRADIVLPRPHRGIRSRIVDRYAEKEEDQVFDMQGSTE